eukprot:8060230-Pyramimonas_sp.AAC.1
MVEAADAIAASAAGATAPQVLEGDTIDPAEDSHHFGLICTDEEFEAQVQMATHRSRELQHSEIGHATAASSSTPPAAPTPPAVRDMHEEDTPSDAEDLFNRTMAAHGFGVIYQDGTLGGAHQGGATSSSAGGRYATVGAGEVQISHGAATAGMHVGEDTG